MYATRRLSELLKSAELVAAPPDGPNSGYLVIQDEESVTYSCFGCCKNRFLNHLPFPQDKELTLRYTTNSGQASHTSLNPLFFIPLLNHPLSSNRYYSIDPHGKRIGYICYIIWCIITDYWFAHSYIFGFAEKHSPAQRKKTRPPAASVAASKTWNQGPWIPTTSTSSLRLFPTR